jgi:hypothetical protein
MLKTVKLNSASLRPIALLGAALCFSGAAFSLQGIPSSSAAVATDCTTSNVSTGFAVVGDPTMILPANWVGNIVWTRETTGLDLYFPGTLTGGPFVPPTELNAITVTATFGAPLAVNQYTLELLDTTAVAVSSTISSVATGAGLTLTWVPTSAQRVAVVQGSFRIRITSITGDLPLAGDLLSVTIDYSCLPRSTTTTTMTSTTTVAPTATTSFAVMLPRPAPAVPVTTTTTTSTTTSTTTTTPLVFSTIPAVSLGLAATSTTPSGAASSNALGAANPSPDTASFTTSTTAGAGTTPGLNKSAGDSYSTTSTLATLGNAAGAESALVKSAATAASQTSSASAVTIEVSTTTATAAPDVIAANILAGSVPTIQKSNVAGINATSEPAYTGSSRSNVPIGLALVGAGTSLLILGRRKSPTKSC